MPKDDGEDDAPMAQTWHEVGTDCSATTFSSLSSRGDVDVDVVDG